MNRSAHVLFPGNFQDRGVERRDQDAKLRVAEISKIAERMLVSLASTPSAIDAKRVRDLFAAATVVYDGLEACRREALP